MDKNKVTQENTYVKQNEGKSKNEMGEKGKQDVTKTNTVEDKTENEINLIYKVERKVGETNEFYRVQVQGESQPPNPAEAWQTGEDAMCEGTGCIHFNTNILTVTR